MTPRAFFETLQEHVDALTPKHVLVGVGEAPPYRQDENFHPYVILWPSPGTPLDERTVTGRMGGEASDLTFQVTVAAPDNMALLSAAQDVTDALTDTRIEGSIIRPDSVFNRAARPLKDDSLRPVRHYMVTTWGTQLTRRKLYV